MKKVLIIAYYWPPSGGGGVIRNLKFAKYLRKYGWEPIIYTPKDPEHPVIDESLFKDVHPDQKVIKHPIWEPYNLYKKFTGKKKAEKVYSGFITEGKPKLSQRISTWIRGNMFIPDARKFWIKPSIRFLTKYLKENPVDAIISSGPPNSMHLIGRGVKRNTGINWIADFRDPWTNIDFYDQLMLSGWADRKHHRLEHSVLKEADKVVTVSWKWAGEFENLGAKKCEVITNGFDVADFEGKEKLDEKFTISHIGSVNADRNPKALWQALNELLEEIPQLKAELKIRFIGNTDFSVLNDIEKYGLGENFERMDYLPHKEAVKIMMQSQVLLLLMNDTPNVLGVIPGKMYEYMAAGRPVFSIGPGAADAAKILEETKAGMNCEFADKAGMKTVIKQLFEQYQTGKLKAFDADIVRFSRESLTIQMAGLLDELSKNN